MRAGMILNDISAFATDGEGAYQLLTFERSGIPIAEVEKLKRSYGFIDKEILAILRMNLRTLQRRRKGDQVLDAHESAAFVAAARCLAYAVEVFGSREKVTRWLRQPNGSLKGETPLELLGSATGLGLVRATLTRIEYGVYS